MEITYTLRDFDAYFDALKTKANEEFPDWTDFNKSNVGVLFLEQLSAVGDQMSYYHNKQINEAFLPTVKRRRNAIKILKRMDYPLGGRVAASVDLTFTFVGGGVHAKDVNIPAGTLQIATEDGLFTFETLENVFIEAGETGGTVSAKNWITTSDSMTFDGSSGQTKTLLNKNFVGMISLMINSLSWTEKEDLLDSGTADRHYYVEINDQIVGTLIFGDGVTGFKPTGSGVATYHIGGGKAANSIQPNKITKIIGNIYDIDGGQVEMEVTNNVSPSGGEDEESIDEARKKAPSASRVQNVTVSRDDYEGNAELVPGVARALAFGHAEDPAIEKGNVIVYIVPEGGGTPSVALLNAVEANLKTEKPVMMSTQVDAAVPTYQALTIAGTITKKSGFLAADVKAAVDSALTTYFGYANLDEYNNYTNDWGYYKSVIYLSAIIGLILTVKIGGVYCVESVTLTAPTGNTTVVSKNMPALGSLAGLVVV